MCMNYVKYPLVSGAHRRYVQLLTGVTRDAAGVVPILCIDLLSHSSVAEEIELCDLDVDYCVRGVYSGNSANSEPGWVSARRAVQSPIVYAGGAFPWRDTVANLSGFSVIDHYTRVVGLARMPSLDPALEVEPPRVDLPSYRGWSYLQWRLRRLRRLDPVTIAVRLHWLDQSIQDIHQ